MSYVANPNRYEKAQFRRCGRSGIVLPPISLGLWQNFGGADVFETGRAMIRRAFDRGVTHFDLANNYGPPYGSAETNFGTHFARDFKKYRDELILSHAADYGGGIARRLSPFVLEALDLPTTAAVPGRVPGSAPDRRPCASLL